MPKLELEKANQRERDIAADTTDRYAWPKRTHKPKHRPKPHTKRATGQSPRAKGVNPRALKRNPRAIKAARVDSAGIRWPIVVTTGPLTANGITVIELKDRAHADKLGYAWVGPPPSSR